MTHQQEPQKTPVDRAVETFVYAPIGLLFEGSSLLPQLVEKGRTQVITARMVGRFAIQHGRTEATKVAGKLHEQAAGVLDLISGTVSGGAAVVVDDVPPPPADPLPEAAPQAEELAAPDPAPSPRKVPSPAREAARRRATGAKSPAPASVAKKGRASDKTATAAATPVAEPPAVEVSSLAIPDYDGLSASHVVNRLPGLSSEELEAVRRYEALNRGRKTILSKVAQLQSS